MSFNIKNSRQTTDKIDEKLRTNKEVYEVELAKIEEKNNGKLTAISVVEEASNPRSPLHDWFDWRDNEAARKWRMHQARILIGTIRVVSTYEGTKKDFRKYVNITIAEDKGRAYIQVKNAVKNPDTNAQILRRALNEITYWERTYSEYKELEEIFTGITKTKKKLRKILVTQ